MGGGVGTVMGTLAAGGAGRVSERAPLLDVSASPHQSVLLRHLPQTALRARADVGDHFRRGHGAEAGAGDEVVAAHEGRP